jgi:hypothetical protein
MDRWWTTEEVRAQPELFRLMVATQTRIFDMNDDVTDSIMRLATDGKIELGDRNGAMLLREPKDRRSAARPLHKGTMFLPGRR